MTNSTLTRVSTERLPDKLTALAQHLLTEEGFAHASRVADRVFTSADAQVALMHDVLEDTDVDEVLFEMAVGSDVMRSVRVVTRSSEETYAEYIERIVRSGDLSAVGVKIADLYDHLSLTLTLTDSLRKRYEKALGVLLPYARWRGVKVRENLRV